MTTLETKLKEQGLFFSFSKLFILAIAITCSLKFLELQFIVIPNFYESGLAVFVRSYFFIFSTCHVKCPKTYAHHETIIKPSTPSIDMNSHFVQAMHTIMV